MDANSPCLHEDKTVIKRFENLNCKIPPPNTIGSGCWHIRRCRICGENFGFLRTEECPDLN